MYSLATPRECYEGCCVAIIVDQYHIRVGGSVAEWLACWAQAQKGFDFDQTV